MTDVKSEFVTKYKVTVSVTETYPSTDYNGKFQEGEREVATTEMVTTKTFALKVFKNVSDLISKEDQS